MFNSINFKKITATSILAMLMAGTLSQRPAISSQPDMIELKFLAGEFQCGSGNPLSVFEMTITSQQNSTPVTLRVGETALVEASNLEDLNINIEALSHGDCIEWSSLADPVFMSSSDQFPSYIDPSRYIYEQTSLNDFQSDLSSSEGFMLMELGGPESETTNSNSESAYDWNDIVLVYDLEPMILTGTIRDFKQDHPDFERQNGRDTNPQGQTFRYGLDTDITTNNLVGGKPEYAGGSYSTTTKSNFDQWYRDVPGVNQSMQYSIQLKDDDRDGIYTYSNNSFFPIDNQLFGNEGRNRNFHFTYELHTQFTYQGGEVFTFSGDDDVWVYINDQKVIDIGGVHSKLTRTVNLDDLGLTIGETYNLDFFFAERHTTQSNFTIETTLVLEDQATSAD